MKILRLIALIPVVAAGLLAQDGQPVNPSESAPPTAYQNIFGYSGSNLIYVCFARASITTGQRLSVRVPISAVSKANPAVVTSTGHGFDLNSRPQISISGATGTGWTAINATWTATIIDADTFSIPIDSSGFGTLAGTVTFNTTAPRTTVPEWAVQKLVYDGSNNLIWKGWLNGSSAYQAKCSEATLSTTNQQ